MVYLCDDNEVLKDCNIKNNINIYVVLTIYRYFYKHIFDINSVSLHNANLPHINSILIVSVFRFIWPTFLYWIVETTRNFRDIWALSLILVCTLLHQLCLKKNNLLAFWRNHYILYSSISFDTGDTKFQFLES